MKPEAIQAWMQLYAAVGLLAMICAGCAFLKTIYNIRSGAPELSCGTWRQRLFCLPRIWLRFQLSYLCGFPSIMGITLLYAHYIGFALFNPS